MCDVCGRLCSCACRIKINVTKVIEDTVVTLLKQVDADLAAFHQPAESPMFALRGALVLASTTALVAAVAITVSGTPAATAANSALLEAESMTVTPSNAGSTV